MTKEGGNVLLFLRTREFWRQVVPGGSQRAVRRISAGFRSLSSEELAYLLRRNTRAPGRAQLGRLNMAPGHSRDGVLTSGRLEGQVFAGIKLLESIVTINEP